MKGGTILSGADVSQMLAREQSGFWKRHADPPWVAPTSRRREHRPCAAVSAARDQLRMVDCRSRREDQGHESAMRDEQGCLAQRR